MIYNLWLLQLICVNYCESERTFREGKKISIVFESEGERRWSMCIGVGRGGKTAVAASWKLRGGHRRLYGMTSAEDSVGILAKRAVGDSRVVCRVSR